MFNLSYCVWIYFSSGIYGVFYYQFLLDSCIYFGKCYKLSQWIVYRPISARGRFAQSRRLKCDGRTLSITEKMTVIRDEHCDDVINFYSLIDFLHVIYFNIKSLFILLTFDDDYYYVFEWGRKLSKTGRFLA